MRQSSSFPNWATVFGDASCRQGKRILWTYMGEWTVRTYAMCISEIGRCRTQRWIWGIHLSRLIKKASEVPIWSWKQEYNQPDHTPQGYQWLYKRTNDLLIDQISSCIHRVLAHCRIFYIVPRSSRNRTLNHVVSEFNSIMFRAYDVYDSNGPSLLVNENFFCS